MKRIVIGSLTALMLIAPLAAQAPPTPEPGSQVPLKVQLVVTRMQGQKQVSSVPYSLAVLANDSGKTSLKMNSEVPVRTPSGSHTYRSIGTNVDCSASMRVSGLYRLALSVSDTSVAATRESVEPASVDRPALPATFRSFNSSFALLLKDGQSAQYTSATDPVTGEVMKVDVTLSVVR